MVSLITGRKGSGKTKRLIEQVNKAVEASRSAATRRFTASSAVSAQVTTI